MRRVGLNIAGIGKEIKKIDGQLEEGMVVTASESIKKLALKIEKEGLGKSFEKLEKAI